MRKIVIVDSCIFTLSAMQFITNGGESKICLLATTDYSVLLEAVERRAPIDDAFVSVPAVNGNVLKMIQILMTKNHRLG
jgi:hypothetical protein